MHGGTSAGPRTLAGIERVAAAATRARPLYWLPRPALDKEALIARTERLVSLASRLLRAAQCGCLGEIDPLR